MAVITFRNCQLSLIPVSFPAIGFSQSPFRAQGLRRIGGDLPAVRHRRASLLQGARPGLPDADQRGVASLHGSPAARISPRAGRAEQDGWGDHSRPLPMYHKHCYTPCPPPRLPDRSLSDAMWLCLGRRIPAIRTEDMGIRPNARTLWRRLGGRGITNAGKL